LKPSGRHKLCEISGDIKGINFKEWPRVGYPKMGAYKNGETQEIKEKNKQKWEQMNFCCD
jgi:hypothetical protein